MLSKLCVIRGVIKRGIILLILKATNKLSNNYSDLVLHGCNTCHNMSRIQIRHV